MAKAMLSARANGTDPLAAVERTIGWQGLEETVEAMDQNLGGSRADNLAEVIERYPRVHRTAAIILGAFTFRSWKSTDSLLTALEVLRQLYASGERKLPAGVPTVFLAPVWRKLIGIGPIIDRRTWEVAVVMTLRDFEHQSKEYRDSVLPSGVKARLAIEQASTFGWERYVGDAGRIIGMETFGASAPLKELQNKFGFEPDRVVATVKEMLGNK